MCRCSLSPIIYRTAQIFPCSIMCSVALKFYDQRDKDYLLKKKKKQVAINEKHRSNL